MHFASHVLYSFQAKSMASCVSSVFRKGLFKNKVAVVTGGATGIGRGITEELVSLGCKVVIASRNEDKLVAAAGEIKQLAEAPTDVSYIKCNVRHEDEVKCLIGSTLQIYGKLDFLVNNGGGQFMSPASDITLKGWHAVVETNLTGTFLLCKEAYNQWMKDHRGAIVNMLMEMYRGAPFMVHSGAARAGIENLTKTLSVEWAEKGVRVNAVAPGTIYSETAAKNYPPGVFEIQRERLPTKRCGTPAEISAAVCFLLSPAASFITGETICIDGGQRLYSGANWTISEHANFPPFPSNM